MYVLTIVIRLVILCTYFIIGMIIIINIVIMAIMVIEGYIFVVR